MDQREEIVRQALSQDLTKYYGEVYDLYAKKIFHLIYSQVIGTPGDLQVTQDLVQETFLKVFQWLKRHPTKILDPETCLFAVLHETATNCTRDYWRNRQTAFVKMSEELTQENEPIDETSPSPEVIIETLENHAEQLEKLRQLLTILSPLDQHLVMLRYGEKYSYQSISTQIGLPREVVESRVQNAMRRLQRRVVNSFSIH
jgi:RNA polymerase sigma factor (sigma-70 family)